MIALLSKRIVIYFAMLMEHDCSPCHQETLFPVSSLLLRVVLVRQGHSTLYSRKWSGAAGASRKTPLYGPKGLHSHINYKTDTVPALRKVIRPAVNGPSETHRSLSTINRQASAISHSRKVYYRAHASGHTAHGPQYVVGRIGWGSCLKFSRTSPPRYVSVAPIIVLRFAH